MVGHTGSLEAAIAAITTVDGCLARVIPAILAAGGTALVTADHGNAEQMWDYELKAPHTAHTTNPVPLILVQGPGASERAAAASRRALRHRPDHADAAGVGALAADDGEEPGLGAVLRGLRVPRGVRACRVNVKSAGLSRRESGAGSLVCGGGSRGGD